MRKHALIDAGIVTEIINLNDESYVEEAKKHDLVVDIDDMSSQPEIGWVLNGSTIAPRIVVVDLNDRDAQQQTAQREFGLKLVPKMIDLVGQRNLKLAREGSSVNVTNLASQMASVKLLLETGALKTARTVCGMLKPAFPSHSDILNIAIAEVTNFLSTNGFE